MTRRRTFAIAVTMLLAFTIAGFAAVLHSVPGAAAAPVRHRPPSQVVDGLYKSLVVALPGGETLVCILTRLPQSFPTFTIPPEYSCVRPPR